MKKFYKTAAWLSGAIGVILMLLGVVAVLAGNILFGHFWTTYLYPAPLFVLLGIFLFLAFLVDKDTE